MKARQAKKQQSEYDTDQRKIAKILADVKEFDSELENLIATYEDDLKNHGLYQSKQNKEGRRSNSGINVKESGCYAEDENFNPFLQELASRLSNKTRVFTLANE